MGRKNRNKVNISEAPVETIEVFSDGEKEIFEVPKEELEVTLKTDETPKRIFTAKVNNQFDLVNVRNVPKGDIVAQVGKGVELRILDINPRQDDDQKDWYNIVGPMGQEGWIMASLIDIFEEGEYKEV